MSAPTEPTGTSPVGGGSRSLPDLPAPAKLVGFVVALVAVFGAAWFLGGQVGPVGEPAAAEHGVGHPDAEQADAPPAPAAVVPGGLQVSEAGYTLVPSRTLVRAGERSVEFRIQGPDGSVVTDYEIEHRKELHLIAVRRDFTGFQHVHPERAPDGTWTTKLDLTGGTWRLFADFTPAADRGEAARPLTLGTDLTVTGPTGRVAGAGPATRRVDTVDGLRVEMTGTLAAEEESDLRFEVTTDRGRAVDLQPYLGARGHLVALREGDLAYLHVHPLGTAGAAGNEVGFAATAPSVGGYRLYLDFRAGGIVRTASFVLPVREASRTSSARSSGRSGEDRGSGGTEHGPGAGHDH